MARLKNRQWNLNCKETDQTFTIEHIKIALLMDIRDELQQLNNVLTCSNLSRYERILRGIRAKLPLRRRKKPVKKVKA